MTDEYESGQTPGRQVNVKDYGAAGDGVSDDTEAIRAATRDGVPYFPPGTYLISGEVTFYHQTDAGNL